MNNFYQIYLQITPAIIYCKLRRFLKIQTMLQDKTFFSKIDKPGIEGLLWFRWYNPEEQIRLLFLPYYQPSTRQDSQEVPGDDIGGLTDGLDDV